MIERIAFKNFKVLREAVLQLEPFTLIVGANGSGKSTALQGLLRAAKKQDNFGLLVSAGLEDRTSASVEIRLNWAFTGQTTVVVWSPDGTIHRGHHGPGISDQDQERLNDLLSRVRLYSLQAVQLASPAGLVPHAELSEQGSSLVVVLDRLRDEAPERFEALNAVLPEWVPEFDKILFENPSQGVRSLRLRVRHEKHSIPAHDLSTGTLLALAMLTLAYLPAPPSIVCIEEPNRGLHPRLLRHIQDALYRLSYPENYGEERQAVQVIATTHSPYMLDLYKDTPEQIVMAQKVSPLEARFDRLADRDDLKSLLKGSHLGDIWYSGILGGVPESL